MLTPLTYADFLTVEANTAYSTWDSLYGLMSCYTGKTVGEYVALLQRISTILSTPVGSIPFNREFGSDLPALVDRPGNATFVLDCYAAIATALRRWEPLFALKQVTLSPEDDGLFLLDLYGEALIDNRDVSLQGLVLNRASSPIVYIR